MKKNYLKTSCFSGIFLTWMSFPVFSQNVGIGTTAPDASAQLDIKSTNKGVLVPRIALTAANVSSPVSSPADALLIYNTATAGASENAVSPGFYYWSAAANKWNAINSATASNSVGFGSWGDCSMNNISDYNPVGASDGSANDDFGYTVSISGNYAILAAPLATVGANTNQGMVYMYFFNGNNWVQQQKLTASDGASGDYFGASTSISGNYAIVGAVSDDIGSNTDQGSAYIFFYNGTSWVQQQKLMAADGAANDYFGFSVSIQGNYVVVGAERDAVGANPFQGSAYAFFYNGSNWIQQQKLTAADGAANDAFGSSVSISGNYIVIGAIDDDIGANINQGSAYIFFYDGSSWAQQQKLTANDGKQNDDFGLSVSVSGSYIIIGAELAKIGSNGQGAAYVYYYDNGSSWVQQQKLAAADGHDNDRFGHWVSISGNYAIVGANQDSVGTVSDQGAAYIFQNVGGIWLRLQKVVNPSGNPEDFLGNSCAISGNRFVAGAYGFANNKGMAVFGKIN